MAESMNQLPEPRAEIADPALTRPDWTKIEGRPRDRLWLDKNENHDPALAAVVRRVVDGLDPHLFATYPDFAPLYAKLAGWLGVGPDQLRLAAGSDGIIHALFESFISPGDVVVHTAPTFAMYPLYSRMFGARAVPVAYDRGAYGPVLSLDRLLSAIAEARPKLVCLPNPDSPTGVVKSLAEIDRLAQAAAAVDALLLIDEAYHPFHPDSAIGLIDRHPNLVIARSTGKAWGLAGIRIGYGIASPAIAKTLHKVRGMYEASTVSGAVFGAMLDHVDAMLASVARLSNGKAAFQTTMRQHGYEVPDCAGNFLLVGFGADAPRIHAALADLVLYRRDFAEPSLAGYSRFSATTPELFQPILQRIAAIKSAGK